MGNFTVTQTRGNNFQSSLKDGRKVWLGDRLVEDVTIEDAFSRTIQTISNLFDLVDDDVVSKQIGHQIGQSKNYHNAFLVPRTKEDLEKRNKAFTIWSKETMGMMSRLSDYARTYITSWYAAQDDFNKFDASFGSKITTYYERAREHDLFLTTAAIDPQIDRSKSYDDAKIAERFLHITKKNEDGIFVSGAKMIATGAPYTHDFIVNSGFLSNGDTHAHTLLVPSNSNGLHIVCREPFHIASNQYQLSKQFDEMDAVLLFDDVFIPWERVLLHGEPKAIQSLKSHVQTRSLSLHQTAVRFVVKFEFLIGVAFAVTEVIGVNQFLHVKEKLGELLTQVEVMRALVIASETEATLNEHGVMVPKLSYLETSKNIGTKLYPRAIEIIQQVGGSGFLQVPHKYEQVNEQLSPFIDKYFEGASVSAQQKNQLFALAWDLIGSQLGSRHELYERFYAGDPVRGYAGQYDSSNKEQYTDYVWGFIRKNNR